MKLELEPQFDWSQDDNFVRVNVWIGSADQDSTIVMISPNVLTVTSLPYRLELQLYGEIDAGQPSSYVYREMGITFALAKKTNEQWPFLVKPRERKPRVVKREEEEQQARESAVVADAARGRRREEAKKVAQDRLSEIEERKRRAIEEAKNQERAQQLAELKLFEEDNQMATTIEEEGDEGDDDEEYHDVATEIDSLDYSGPVGQVKKVVSPQSSWDEREFQDVISPSTAGRPRSADNSPGATGRPGSGDISKQTAPRARTVHIPHLAEGEPGSANAFPETQGITGTPANGHTPPMIAGQFGSMQISPSSAGRHSSSGVTALLAGVSISEGISPTNTSSPGSARDPPGLSSRRGSARVSSTGGAGTPPASASRPGSSHMSLGTPTGAGSAHTSPGPTTLTDTPGSSPADSAKAGSTNISPGSAARPGSGHVFTAGAVRPRSAQVPSATTGAAQGTARRPGTAHVSSATRGGASNTRKPPASAPVRNSADIPQRTTKRPASVLVGPGTAERPGSAEVSKEFDYLDVEAEDAAELQNGERYDEEDNSADHTASFEADERHGPQSMSGVPPRNRMPAVAVEFTELQTELPAREKREEELKTYQRVPLADKNGSKHIADIDERHPQHLREKAKSFMDRGLFRDAINAYTEILAVDPRSTVALVNRAVCCTALGEVRVAYEDANIALELMGVGCDSIFNMSKATKHKDNVLTALQIRVQALAPTGDNPGAITNCHLGLQLERGCPIFQELGTQLQGPPPKVQLEKGNDAYKAKNYDTALELFTKVTDHVAAQSEDKARAFANLAALYLKRNQIPEALEACNRSLDARLRTSSSHRDVLMRVAEHYAGQSARREEGLRLQKVIARRGLAYEQLGRFLDAERDFEIAMFMAKQLKSQGRIKDVETSQARLTLLRLGQTTGATP